MLIPEKLTKQSAMPNLTEFSFPRKKLKSLKSSEISSMKSQMIPMQTQKTIRQLLIQSEIRQMLSIISTLTAQTVTTTGQNGLLHSSRQKPLQVDTKEHVVSVVQQPSVMLPARITQIIIPQFQEQKQCLRTASILLKQSY